MRSSVCCQLMRIWLALKEAIQVGPVPGFGKKLSSCSGHLSFRDVNFIFKLPKVIEFRMTTSTPIWDVLPGYCALTVLDYDKETIYFDEVVRIRKRQDLESQGNLCKIFHPAYNRMLDHLYSKVFDSFKISLEQLLNKGEGFAAAVRTCLQSCLLEFDQGCADAATRQTNWDASKVQKELHHDIHEHASMVCRAKLSEIKANYEEKLSAALTEPMKYLFEVGCEDTWASVRRLLERETKAAAFGLSNAIAGFELDKASSDAMVQNLRSYARTVVEKKAREEVGKVLIHMKDRFLIVFNHDNDSMPRVWTREVDIKTILKNAQSASLRVLSDMAVIRLDEKPDMIRNLLFSSLMGGTVDTLASNTWEQVSPSDMLKSPIECMYLWDQFKEETKYVVNQAMSAQEAHKPRNNWLPSPWALAPVVAAFFGFATDEVKENM
ncbi:hypothetical protein Pint_11636 [Pistacia integerrima]|uniref:Uncharacterized protein n=1 Tax=Pistacia integerrima TaxID=434235 RepID=A0ACC0XKC4_9ROSI|nr:hypothetical protein Pint_11636 [Pistacia integerrima]